MKPSRLTSTLLCAALLPAAAAAQTGGAPAPAVQVYGVLDAGVENDHGCANCANTQLSSGIASGSRLGVKGREALGGGSAAVFTLEAGLAADTGKSDPGNKLFGRQAFVGLDGPLGMLTLGRQYNLVYDTLTDVADPFRGGMAGSAANLVGYTSKRYDNSIKYMTPALHGLRAAAIYSVGESPNNSSANRAYGVTLGYESVPVNLSVSHQRKNNPVDGVGSTPPVDYSARNTLLAANVKLGPATAYAAYGRSKGEGSSPWDMSNPYGAVAMSTPSNDSRDLLFGVALPRGAATWLASYIHKDDRSVLNRDARQIAVGLSYRLSPRTDVYSSFARIRNSNGGAYTIFNSGDTPRGDRSINIGLRHAF